MLKRILSAALILAALVFTAPPARAGGGAASLLPAKSPLRYLVIRCQFSTTASTTGTLCGTLPPGGAILRDVVITQNAAGVGGTSWIITPKRNAVALTSTNGGFTLAAGASKSTNVNAAPMGTLTNPTGGTRPVIAGDAQASGTITVTAGIAAAETVTVNGVTFTFVSSGATGNQVNVGADQNAAATNLAAVINANTSTAIRGAVTATAATGTVTIKARTPGSDANAIATTVSGAHLSAGGATLSGGFNALSTGGEIVTADVTLTGTYSTAVSGEAALYFEPRN